MQSLVVVVFVALVVYALVDCLQSPTPVSPALPRGLWLALIVLVPFAGAIGWLLLRDRQAPGPRRPVHPVGPDDDPEFLRRLGGPPHTSPPA